jgi:hypothetical protein
MGDAALAFANKPLWSDRDAVTTSYVGWPEGGAGRQKEGYHWLGLED